MAEDLLNQLSRIGARKPHLSAYGPEAERLRERLRDARPKAEANLARLVALAER